MSDAEKRLLTLLRERCYREGDFTLSSGVRSSFYFDAKQLFLSSEGAALIGEVLYERTKDLPIQAIGGLEIGAVPLATAAAYAYHKHGRTMEGFFVRNEAKGHGTKKIIEGRLQPGWRVAVVDDVATTGESTLKAIRAVRHAECEPALVTVLVDRLEGAKELFAREGIDFRPVFTIADFKQSNPSSS